MCNYHVLGNRLEPLGNNVCVIGLLGVFGKCTSYLTAVINCLVHISQLCPITYDKL